MNTYVSNKYLILFNILLCVLAKCPVGEMSVDEMS